MLAVAPPVALDDTYAVPIDDPLVVDSPTTTVGARITQNIPPGAFGFGAALIPQQSILMRFEVFGPVRTARIGGLLSAWDSSTTAFAAIVALTGPNDFPDSVEMTTPDVLGHTLIPLTNDLNIKSAELSLELSEGWYALVFGGGRLGATGTGTAHAVIRDNNYTYYSSEDGWSPLPNHEFQIFVDAEGVRGGVLDNDSDPEGFPLTASVETPPEHGALVLDADGTFTYTPEPGFLGIDSFRYTVSNGASQSTATAWLGRPHAPPITNNDRYDVTEGQPLVGTSVLANDFGENLEAVLVAGPETGTLEFNADGTFVYNSAVGRVEADRFLYRVRSGTLWSAPATVTLNIIDANIAPDANNDLYRIGPGETLMSGVGERLARAIYFTDEGLASLNRIPIDGGLIERFRSLVFPASAIALDLERSTVYYYIGAPEYRIYRQSFFGGPQDLVVQMPEIEYEWGGGTRRDNPNVRDMAIDAAAGWLYYTTHHVGDYPAKVSRVNVNDGRIEDLWQSPGDYPQGIDLDLRDRKVYWTTFGQILRTSIDAPGPVEAVVDGIFGGGGFTPLALDIPRGQVYWGEEGGFGLEQIRRANLDGSGSEMFLDLDDSSGITDLAIDPGRGQLYWTDYWFDTITRINLDGTGRELVLRNGLTNPYGFTLDQVYPDNYVYGVLANDSDVDNDGLTARVVTGPQHGQLVLDSDGGFRYVPRAGFVGRDTFTYVANDGQTDSQPATVTIFVGNAAPVANADSYETAEDVRLTKSAAEGVLANDSDDGASPLTAVLVSEPSRGRLTLSPDGAFSYIPAENFFGEDSFEYSADDGETRSAPVTVTIRIASVNDVPTAGTDFKGTRQGQSLSFPVSDLLANDTDADGDTLRVTGVRATADTRGTVALADGAITYAPAAGFFGTASFEYTVSDGNGGESTGVVIVEVERLTQNTAGKAQGTGTLDGGRRSFHFNVQSRATATGHRIQGQLVYLDLERRLFFFATNITSFRIDANGRLASFSGVGVLNGRSGVAFTLSVEDNAGTNLGRDKFRIELSRRGFEYDSLDHARNGGRIDRFGDIRVKSQRNAPTPIALAHGLVLAGMSNEGRYETLVERLARGRVRT